MLWRDLMHLVLRSITSSPLRSILTALGIAIGIAAVALLTSIGEGIRGYVMENFSQFGTRIIAVNPGKTDTQGIGGLFRTHPPLPPHHPHHAEADAADANKLAQRIASAEQFLFQLRP